MGSKNIVIFLSSVRPNRMNERVASFVKETVSAAGMTPILMDPLETPMELVALPIHFMPNPDEAPAWMKEMHEKIKTADGFIVITAEYNSTLPPALSNMIDHFPPASYRHRPCALVGYSMGAFGGCRVLNYLRSFVAELGLLPTPSNVPIPAVHEVFNADGSPVDVNGRVPQNIKKMVEELGWYVDALKNHAAVTPRPN